MLELIPFHCFKLELPAIEHNKVLSFQTICWLPGERSLPIGLLVTYNFEPYNCENILNDQLQHLVCALKRTRLTY